VWRIIAAGLSILLFAGVAHAQATIVGTPTYYVPGSFSPGGGNTGVLNQPTGLVAGDTLHAFRFTQSISGTCVNWLVSRNRWTAWTGGDSGGTVTKP